MLGHATALAEIATLLPRDADRIDIEELVLGLAILAQRLGRQADGVAVGGRS